jgi:hypothetical protein
MSVYVRQQIILVASNDKNEANCSFKREDKALSSQTETFEVESSGEAVLSAAEADYVLPMGKVVTGKVLFVEADKQVTLKLNGGAEVLTVGPPGTGTKGKFFLRGDFTAVSVTNADASAEAAVSYLIAGQKA